MQVSSAGTAGKRFAGAAVFVFFTLFTLGGCGDDYLRGSVKPSADGKTYLSIVDDNGGHCGPVYVDGEQWKYKIGEAGPVSPGDHTIKCGAEISFEIPEGTVFSFDYWGP